MDVPRPALGRRGRAVRKRRGAVPRRADAAVLAVLRRAAGAAGELTIGGSVIDLSLSSRSRRVYIYTYVTVPTATYTVERASGSETLESQQEKSGRAFQAPSANRCC